MRAFLVLEDGTVFQGTHIGAEKEVISEIVFSTGVVGYLEEMTDPSNVGTAVCMTYPLIGNYGVCREDAESERPWVDAIIVRELSRIPSNFRCDMTIQQYLEENGIPGIAGIDTRALTKRLRDKGTMNGMLTTNENYNLDEILLTIKEHKTTKAVEQVSCKAVYQVKATERLEENGPVSGTASFDKEAYERGEREKAPSNVKELNGAGLKVAMVDFGAKRNIAKALSARGCQVTVYPAWTNAEEILAAAPDGILLSNGPGNPKEYPEIIEEVKKLYQADVPVFGMDLGHLFMALAAGADTYKMKCGHRGSHAVKDLETGKVYISGQNHGYAVDADKLNPAVIVPAFVNVNDGTNEGLRYIGKDIFTVQFHPEACPGPHETGYLFDRFIGMMKRHLEMGGKENA